MSDRHNLETFHEKHRRRRQSDVLPGASQFWRKKREKWRKRGDGVWRSGVNFNRSTLVNTWLGLGCRLVNELESYHALITKKIFCVNTFFRYRKFKGRSFNQWRDLQLEIKGDHRRGRPLCQSNNHHQHCRWFNRRRIKSSDRLHVRLNDISSLRYSPYQVKKELQFQGLLISHWIDLKVTQAT